MVDYLRSKLLVNLSVLMKHPTGISTYILNLLPYLSSLSPTLLISDPIPSYKCYPIPANQTPEQGLRGHFRRFLWTQLELPKIYQALAAQLLFSPLPEAPLFSPCRYVVMAHDLIPLRFPQPNSPLTFYFRYYSSQVLKQAEHILCNSTATARDITDFFSIPSAKITPILLSYNAKHFRLLNIPYKEKYCPYFLYLGRHNPYKNLHRLINAFARMSNYHDCQLWLAGPHDRRYTPKLQAQVQELDLGDRVKFLDYVSYDQLPILLNQALALVFPTLWEGFGLPALEAMACGTPVITSNLASLPEVTGDAALLINPYKTEEITAAMEAIANDSKLRSHLSILSLQRASQFSWEKTGQATLEVLQRYL
jgi:glycosyltransferase involved in cell wall biosynthesis